MNRLTNKPLDFLIRRAAEGSGVGTETEEKYKLPSEWINAKIFINRRPIDLKKRPYLEFFYDFSTKNRLGSKNVVLVSGRQVEKSTTLAVKAITLGYIYSAFSTLIIQPRFDQVRVFSQQRFHPICVESPAVAAMMSTKRVWQVSAREFINGSFFNFKSCFYSADPIRGITANHLAVDEAQDIISDNLPILAECQSHVPLEGRYNTMSGTPKTNSNTLSLAFKETCQYEWMPLCGACNNRVYLDEKVIGKTCYICPRCGKPIDVLGTGKWIPQRRSKLDDAWGFRISQIMVPFMTHRDVLKKMENPAIPRRVFFNECLGLPFDEGQLVLTRADILAACEQRHQVIPKTIGEMSKYFVVAGIDHGVGEYAVANRGMKRARAATSFTAMAFGAFNEEGVFRVFKIFRFTGEASNLASQPAAINQLARQYAVRWAMSDWGFGAQTNARLLSDFGWSRLEAGISPVLLECQYHGGTTPVSWSPAAFRYMVSRNWAIEKTVDAIKTRRLRFFNQVEMDEYIDDFTSMYTEYDFTHNRLFYDHNLPDDCFQAVIYAYLAALQHRGELVPSVVPNINNIPGIYEGGGDWSEETFDNPDQN